MSSYEDLADTIDKIVDAAIESEMDHRDYPGTVDQGFTHEGPYVHISPPTGVSRRGGGVRATDQDGHLVDDLGWDPAGEVYGPWRERIHEAFARWVGLPDPDALEGPVDACDVASRLLSDGGSADAETGISGGNTALSHLGTMNSELAQFNGETIDAFTRNYSQRLPIVVRNQSSVAAMLWIGARAEQKLWRSARTDVATIADKVLEAMRASHPSGGGDFSGFLKVVGTVTSVAGLFVSGGTAAPVIAATGVGAGVLGALLPDHRARAAASSSTAAAPPVRSSSTSWPPCRSWTTRSRTRSAGSARCCTTRTTRSAATSRTTTWPRRRSSAPPRRPA